MKSRQLIKILKQNGFEHQKNRGKGGHQWFEKNGFPPIIIPQSSGDVAKGTLLNAFKKAGLEELRLQIVGKGSSNKKTKAPQPQ